MSGLTADFLREESEKQDQRFKLFMHEMGKKCRKIGLNHIHTATAKKMESLLVNILFLMV